MKNTKEVNQYDRQAAEFMIATKTTFKATFKTNDFYFPGDKKTRDIYRCTLKTPLGSYTFDFGRSINNSDQNTAPRPYDIFASVTKYDCGTFENFCSEFGYDTDSRTAERTYKAVCKEFKNIARIYTPEQLELMQEIQ